MSDTDGATDKRSKKRRESKYSVFVPKSEDKGSEALKKFIPKKEKDEESYDEKCLKKCKGDMKKNDTIAGMFAVGVQAMNFIEVEEYFREDLPDKERNVSSMLNFYLRVVMLGLSTVIGIHIYFHYKYMLEVEKLLK